MSQGEHLEIEVLRRSETKAISVARGCDRVAENRTQFLTPLFSRLLSAADTTTTTASATIRDDQHSSKQFRSSSDTDTDLAHQLLASENSPSGGDKDLARFTSQDSSGTDRISSNHIYSQSTTRDTISSSTQHTDSVETTRAIPAAVDATDESTTTSQQQSTFSAENAPRSDMGYSNTIQSQSRRSQNASIKMERTPSLHSSTSSGPKDLDADENISVDSVGFRAASSSDPVMSPQSPSSPVGTRNADIAETVASSVFGTPSTISTAPSTEADETSADGTDSLGLDIHRSTWRLDDSVTPMLLPRNPGVQSIRASASAQHGIYGISSSEHEAAVASEQMYHHRSHSWDQQPIRQHGQVRSWEGSPVASPYPSPRSHATQPGTWEQVGAPQSRVASFRNGAGAPHAPLRGYSNVAAHHPAEGWHQVPRSGEPRHHHGGEQPRQHHGHPLHVDTRTGPGYHQHAFGGAGFHGQRSPAYGQHPSGARTPPRSKAQARSPIHTPQRSPSAPSTPVSGSPSASGPNPPRSSSEILKTLLRKKACLYEPDTSKAVAFVTWLVGRELALEHGYFSRQQLQSGVHACVAKKIEAGVITRTKVNRCMQIILNSCFHYIIPRPDGSEENGEAFRDTFAAVAVDDSNELAALPRPWNDLSVDREFVLTAASREASPANSPRLGSQQSKAEDEGHVKRAVLLCFNENVRSFEDVLRCHNEFIRDTANAANLQLSDKEWHAFFGRDSTKTTIAWGSPGASAAVTRAEGGVPKIPDVLGRMTTDELSRFRTTWCAKRYEHDHDQCAFAHVGVNGGWLRRNPLSYQYRPEMCPSVVRVADKMVSPFSFMLNECEKGEKCDFAHSNEEVSYHPDRYKRKMCTAVSSKGGGCPLGDICPDFHTSQNVPRGKRRSSPDRRSHRASNYKGTHGHGSSGGKGVPALMPEGSPMIYVDPAPVSSFEEHLGPPGLQSLFRRHSSVVAGYVRHGERCKCCYSNFGDDSGIGLPGQAALAKSSNGLPSVSSTRSSHQAPSR